MSLTLLTPAIMLAQLAPPAQHPNSGATMPGSFPAASAPAGVSQRPLAVPMHLAQPPAPAAYPPPGAELQIAARPSYPDTTAGPPVAPPHFAAPANYPAAPAPTYPTPPVAGPVMQSTSYAESVPAPYPGVIDDSTCCEPLPSCYTGCGPGLSRFIWHPPALGCGQFGCQRLWGDPNLEPDGFTLAGLARGYFFDDQRVQWSGLEATFGAESALNPRYVTRSGNWLMRADGVFFLNQPFEPNILVDPNRASYVKNFYPDVFQIWQLNLAFTRGDFTVAVGKDRTPFGRYYFPIYSNSYFDAPFVRTEVIKWVETGLFLRYSPGPLNLEVAATNGGIDRDTNSSKALVCRAGFDQPNWALGASAKIQDGTGSEHQKLNNNYYGFDAMARWGRFELSGEAVWDKYGFREIYDPNGIFWGRSVYYREIYNGTKDGGLHGFGYYVNLAYIYGRLRLDFNYGEYHPDQIGNPYQDTPNARAMLQASFEVMRGVQTFLVYMSENDRPREEWRHGQGTNVLYTGVQWMF